MKKYFYFSTGDAADATGEAALYPVDALRGVDPTAATTIALHFNPQDITTVAASDDVDVVVLTIATGTIKTVLKELVEEINFGKNPFIVLDKDNEEFAIDNVSDCAITYAA